MRSKNEVRGCWCFDGLGGHSSDPRNQWYVVYTFYNIVYCGLASYPGLEMRLTADLDYTSDHEMTE